MPTKRPREEEEWSTIVPEIFDHDVNCYCGQAAKRLDSKSGRKFFVCHSSESVERLDPEGDKAKIAKAVDGYFKGCWFFSWHDELDQLQKCKMCALYMKKEGWRKDKKAVFYSCKNNHRLRKSVEKKKQLSIETKQLKPDTFEVVEDDNE